MRTITLVSMVAGSLLVACGGEAASGIGAGDLSPGTTTVTPSSGGTGSLTVMSNRPAAGAGSYTYERSVSFISAGATACATTNVGACQVNPCFVTTPTQAATAPNAGEVTILGAEMAALPLEPQTNGFYASVVVDGQLPWETGGEPVTLGWAHLPGDPTLAGGQVHMATPPYIALTAGSTFASTANPVSRAGDVTLSWTSDSPATALDTVLLDLTSPNVGGSYPSLSTRLTCTFEASAGQGVVLAAAMQSLSAGTGSYDVHSKEYLSETLDDSNGAQWKMGFNVDAHARTNDGLATGPVTLE